jgi:DNA-binding response OmpR family regulator
MRKRVLVCDNEEVLRTLVRASLQEHYEVDEAENADEALALARRLHPDVVLLDMMMPGRSGLDVLKELRADPELRTVAVVMLTARAQAEDKGAALALGADRFVSKPFSPRDLVAMLADLLRERRVPD